MTKFHRLLLILGMTGILPVLLITLGLADWTYVGEILAGIPAVIWCMDPRYGKGRKLFLFCLWAALYLGHFAPVLQRGINGGELFQTILYVLSPVSYIASYLDDALGEWVKVFVLSGALLPVGLFIMALSLFWIPPLLVILVNVFIDLCFNAVGKAKGNL